MSAGLSPLRLTIGLALTLSAFAANSVLCRAALTTTDIDAASFTAVRLAAGALVLLLLVLPRTGPRLPPGDAWSATALFAYAAAFSFSYREVGVATGALLLFGAVQLTMLGAGWWRGERLSHWQWLGVIAACGGLVWLLAPGVSAPPVVGAALMLAAGVAWGLYSLRGRSGGDALALTAGNFLRSLPLAALLVVVFHADLRLDTAGFGYALASGALASGLGYAVWYTVLPALGRSQAATVQLAVPVLAAVGGLSLGEVPGLRFLLAAALVLGGILLVLRARTPAP